MFFSSSRSSPVSEWYCKKNEKTQEKTLFFLSFGWERGEKNSSSAELTFSLRSGLITLMLTSNYLKCELSDKTGIITTDSQTERSNVHFVILFFSSPARPAGTRQQPAHCRVLTRSNSSFISFSNPLCSIWWRTRFVRHRRIVKQKEKKKRKNTSATLSPDRCVKRTIPYLMTWGEQTNERAIVRCAFLINAEERKRFLLDYSCFLMAHYLAERQHHRKKGNFLQQFRDEQSKELKQLTASQFMEVWSHYDIDGKRWDVAFFLLSSTNLTAI